MKLKTIFFIVLVSIYVFTEASGNTVFDETLMITTDLPGEWFSNSAERDYLGPVFSGITSRLKFVSENDNRALNEYWSSLQSSIKPFLTSDKVLFREKISTNDGVTGERKVFKIIEDNLETALDITIFPSLNKKNICIIRYDYDSFYKINPGLKQIFSTLIMETHRRFFFKDSGMSFKIPANWSRDYKSIDGEWEFHSLDNRKVKLNITTERSEYELQDFWNSYIQAHELRYFSYTLSDRKHRKINNREGLLIKARAIGNYTSSKQSLFLVKNGSNIIIMQYDIPDDGSIGNSFEKILEEITFYK